MAGAGGRGALNVPPEVEGLLRELAPQVLGTLARRFGDFSTAEDAVQEALLAAATHWSRDGVPVNPRGWLTQTATRRMIDAWRSDQARESRERLVAAEPAREAQDEDDTLVVLLLCCHPSLTPASAIALTLRAVGGLTTAEVARAFLVPEPTMAQRISRAKRIVAGERFALPTPDELPARLRSVRHVLYLMFNEGYAATGGPTLHRTELSDEAIRLIRTLHASRPDDSETTALLALMLLDDARRPARTDATGALVPLPDQDRSRWDHALIAEGTALLDESSGHGVVGEYRLQAAIASLHDHAAHARDTDWPQIVALYGLLEKVTGNPVVTVNRAVATAMAEGPRAGLAVLDGVDLPGHRVDAVRAHLHEMAGDVPEALAHYGAAIAGATSVPEREHLVARAARLRASALG
ncbi:sigma-70 family RNA polymerase sigma factor [Cellulomonas sp.]|uniref:RNA polymerase sigma factor n=1 Tax=Cellulomonas sp. TaxID=40001 RepID=UPI0025B85269|nr:sigma-70 family RNA polymerase sigma factor [Cellulomonas sp.]